MKTNSLIVACACLMMTLAGCSSKETKEEKKEAAQSGPDSVATATDSLALPAPFTSESVENRPEEAGWPDGKTPTAPAGFTVSKYADKLKNPRWTYVAPNGDVFVAESNTKKSADRITILRDVNKDGKPEIKEIFMENLQQPLGMLVLKDYFYVANTNGVYRFPYKAGETKITSKGDKIVDLPAGGYNNHWTRNLLANADGSKIYISVGSATNVADHGMDEEKRRANILEVNPDGTGERIYASGLRNPVGMDWAPGSNTLWTAVNERDKLGDELVPDYITSVKEGGFYGWPYAYFGKNEDPRRKGERPDLVAKTLVPDVSLGAHTASLGLAFYDQTQFPAKYQNGAFIGQHGSWNRSKLSGYKVVFVPFKNGKSAGKPEDFLTGFVESEKKVYGRPVGVTVMEDGSMLVNDDSGGIIWRVSAK
ncbi:sorbosone dehydrogenase family protein [Dyadobacter chenwenxiniae]|uniref:Sorbosone dehydrogenase family protein n=1 Tax=Dyadobacter chenwenxiniae TaxID=2906456 RepID=A0A9X1THV3_9BACT|nr:sorbosone dehydrogenase family protein [Dyadobacter chenwenxiniae]MCF0064854.1 sorbosone dehydrogenase family protein [Dyadobacter chenwenxiniae]UON82977.1 sorbosone dehydrogenase family protein [Dyadobacter chenwenxiniae]